MRDAMTLPIEKEERPPFTPNEAWIEAFTAQNTGEMREAAKRYAARRMRRIGESGAHVDEYDIRALVQDALTDTLFGEITWGPGEDDTRTARARHDQVPHAGCTEARDEVQAPSRRRVRQTRGGHVLDG